MLTCGCRPLWAGGQFGLGATSSWSSTPSTSLRQARDRLQMQFMEIEQGERSVREYDAEFSRLLVHAGFGMEGEHQLMKRFLEGLRMSMRTPCRAGMYTTRAGLVELAASVEADLSGSVGLVAVPLADAPANHPQKLRLRVAAGEPIKPIVITLKDVILVGSFGAFWSIWDEEHGGTWHGRSSTGYAKEEGEAILKTSSTTNGRVPQLDRPSFNSIELRSQQSNPKNVASPLTFL
ncbi:unnamed protein product [Microthlaspi erraticum]|uniref:Retrotransposon gag domain-containing protein n=1 Tax=Microthlaspi erraticum TaxID=1685480 RepID=A0A6D2KJP1_9BRAS|nr:unnamed protein product [Microthlaspi erraticum]